MIKKILIAVDHGATAEAIARYGYQLARQLSAELALVSVVDTEFLMTDGGVTPGEMLEMLKRDFTEEQKLLVKKVFETLEIQSFIEEGKPYEKIIAVAEEWNADLIVLGTHGRKGVSHILLGSVAEKVTRHTHIPLLIIPIR